MPHHHEYFRLTRKFREFHGIEVVHIRIVGIELSYTGFAGFAVASAEERLVPFRDLSASYRAEEFQKRFIFLPVLFGKIADERTGFLPNMRRKGEI